MVQGPSTPPLDQESGAVRKATDGRGIGVVFDLVGWADAREQLRCLAWGGGYLTIGFAAGEIPTVKVNQTIMKGVSIIGVAYGMSAVLDPGDNLEDLRQLFEWYEGSRVTPTISNRFPLAQAATRSGSFTSVGYSGKLSSR